LSGAFVPADRLDEIAEAMLRHGVKPAEHLHTMGHEEATLLPYELAKGLELDGIVVVEPERLLDGTARSARLLYIALTRAVQELTVVTADLDHWAARMLIA
jgi:DNA helicase IV